MSGLPDLDSGSGVPAGSEFGDDFATGLDAAWTHAPAVVGGITSAQWTWDSGGFINHNGTNLASSAFPRTNPDGDFWWVYARPTGASGSDVMSAHLRITGYDTDTQFNAQFLMLDIDTDEMSLWRNGTGGELASASVTTANDTPYLIHAHVFGSTVIVRRGQLGQPLEMVLARRTAHTLGAQAGGRPNAWGRARARNPAMSMTTSRKTRALEAARPSPIVRACPDRSSQSVPHPRVAA